METVKEGKICVEVYRGELPAPDEVEQEKSRAVSKYEAVWENLQRKKGRYQELGFKAQAEIVDKEIDVLKKEVTTEAISKSNFRPEALGYQVITPEEMRIWSTWLPTEYTEDELEDYRFDRIPQATLTEFEAAKSLGLFETFTLRSPETQKVQDPILIGWFNRIPYLISRWGESLRPFSEIKSIVEKSWKITKIDKYCIAPFCIVAMIAFFIIGTISMEKCASSYWLLAMCFLLTIGAEAIALLLLSNLEGVSTTFLNRHRLSPRE